jgi:hypothetical protein
MHPAASFGLCLAAASLLRPAARGQEPVIVVKARSGDDLVAAFRYLAPLLGEKGAPKAFDGWVAAVAGKKGLAGVFHMSKPLGLYAAWDTKENQPANPVFVLPVADEKAFFSALRWQLLFPVQVGKGVYRVFSAHLPSAVYFRFAEGHVCITGDAALLRGRLPSPAALLSAPAGGALLSAALHVRRIPKESRAAAVRDFEKEMVGGPDDRADTQALERMRLAFNAQVTRTVKSLVEENQVVALAVHLDPKRHHLVAEASLTPAPASPLARQVRGVGATPSLFRNLGGPRAPLRLAARLPLPETFSKLFLTAGQDQLERLVAGGNRASFRRLLRALEPTLKQPELDVGATLVHSANDKDGRGVIVGVRVQNPRRLETVLRDHVKDMTRLEKLTWGVKWNHIRRGDARIHSFRVLRVGSRERFWFALHRDALLIGSHEGLKRSLAERGRTSGKSKGALVAEATFDTLVLVQAAVRLLLEDEADGAALLAALFSGQTRDALAWGEKLGRKVVGLRKRVPGDWTAQPGVRMELDGGSTLRLRVELNTRVLDLLINGEGP